MKNSLMRFPDPPIERTSSGRRASLPQSLMSNVQRRRTNP